MKGATIETRLLLLADLCDAEPLEGEHGDLAYEMIREAAAELGSYRLRVERLTAEISQLQGRIAGCRARFSMHGCGIPRADIGEG